MKIRNWDKVIKARNEEEWNDLLLCSGVKDLKHNICIPLFGLNSVRLVTTQTLTSDRNSAAEQQRDHWEIFNTDLLHFTRYCDKKKMYTIIYTNFGRGYKNMFLPSVWRSLVSHLKVDRIINLWRRIRRCHWKCCFDAWIYYSVWALTYLISEINKLCLCDSVSADLLAQQPPSLYWQNIIDLALQGQTRYTIRSKLSR